MSRFRDIRRALRRLTEHPSLLITSGQFPYSDKVCQILVLESRYRGWELQVVKMRSQKIVSTRRYFRENTNELRYTHIFITSFYLLTGLWCNSIILKLISGDQDRGQDRGQDKINKFSRWWGRRFTAESTWTTWSKIEFLYFCWIKFFPGGEDKGCISSKYPVSRVWAYC